MAVPRYLPDDPLPPYAYVPGGRFPHPVRDPGGHSFGHRPTSIPLDPHLWHVSRDYLLGFDLFNHGYYWEAHEIWEGLWRLAGRDTAVGELLQGLIKLTASGVKVREGRSAGTTGLAEGARDLFTRARSRFPGQPTFLGLRFADLIAFTHQAAALATDQGDEAPDVRVVFPFVLHPARESET